MEFLVVIMCVVFVALFAIKIRKAWNRVVINAQGHTILISHLELEWIGSALLNPICVGKVVGIKTCQELCLVMEFLITTKERHTRLVPSAWHNGILALRTINGKEIQGLVVGIVKTYWHYDMTKAQIGCT